MPQVHIILRTSVRGGTNLCCRDPWGSAYMSRKDALNAICEELAYMFGQGDDPGRSAVSVPEIVEDPDNTNHNHGALKFRDPDAEGLSRIEIWDPDSCPDACRDEPDLSNWAERFDIETFEILSPLDGPHKPSKRRRRARKGEPRERVFLNDALQGLATSLLAGGFTAPDKAYRPKGDNLPGVWQCIDGRGYYDEGSVFKVERAWVHDGVPFVAGRWMNDHKTDVLDLQCHDGVHLDGYEESWWNVRQLLASVEKNVRIGERS